MFGTYAVRDCRGKCVVLHWKLTPHPSHSDKYGLHLQKDSDAIFNYSETSRTHLTLIVFLAQIVDVFLQFNLWEKIIWCIFVLNFPFSGLSFSAHLSTNKMWNKIYLYCYFPVGWPSFFVLKKTKRWSQYFHCSLTGNAHDSDEKIKTKTESHWPAF